MLDAIRCGLQIICHDRLKPTHLQAWQDTLPTGYGKPLVYQIVGQYDESGWSIEKGELYGDDTSAHQKNLIWKFSLFNMFSLLHTAMKIKNRNIFLTGNN